MLFECATITSISTDRLMVQSIRGSACERCARGEGCGGGVIGKLVYRKQPALDVAVANAGEFEVGQTVELSIEPGRLLQLAALIYLIPLAAVLSGAVIGHFLFATNTGALAGTVGGLFGALWFMRRRLGPVLEDSLRPTVRSEEVSF
ncbi:MAG: SoxR reducing system RseC family protein [Gammaproteobacteria bacterium]